MPVITDRYRRSKEYFLVYCELINAARYRGTVTYQEIATIMGLPLRGSHMAKEVGHLLGEISEDEHRQGRPMLSAIAVKVTGSPGPGFFGFARDLGKLKDTSEKGEQAFWETEKAAIYDTWQKNFKSK